MAWLKFFIFIVAATAFAYFAYVQFDATFSTEEVDDSNVACTMDAKQCPDGSYVGRVGPDCEFAACPSE